MVFSSTEFLFIFFPIVILLYFNPLLKKFKKSERKIKNAIMLIASLVFYAWGEPRFVFIMLGSIFVNWIFGLLIDKYNDFFGKRKAVLVISIIFNLSLLFVFKYLAFTLNNLGVDISIALPIGISFFTFHIMSYIFDLYKRKTGVQKNILKLALYISMFPQLVAGPIVRYETVAASLSERKETPEDFTAGLSRFVFGLGKKLILSNYFAVVADNIFGSPVQISVAAAWLGAICYTLQIFFDFSGYSDMAIGMARMFGFRFLENFNYPYIAKSITDFWRRWHMSLSSWFRDYLYIPLGGNRKGKARQILNLLIVWFLTGFWHGANWTFMCWGLLYFVLLVFEKTTHFPEKIKFFSHIYTMFFVILAWVLFRSDNIGTAGNYIASMFGISGGNLVDPIFFVHFFSIKWVLLVGILLCAPIVPFIRDKLFKNEKSRDVIKSLGVLAVFVLAILLAIKSTYNPFIYFNF